MNALALTSNGCEVLNVLLDRTHPLIIDACACDKPIPKFSQTSDLSDYYIAMQEHVTLHYSSGRICNQIEKTRMISLKNMFTNFSLINFLFRPLCQNYFVGVFSFYNDHALHAKLLFQERAYLTCSTVRMHIDYFVVL